jgi:hypothetical protein
MFCWPRVMEFLINSKVNRNVIEFITRDMELLT